MPKPKVIVALSSRTTNDIVYQLGLNVLIKLIFGYSSAYFLGSAINEIYKITPSKAFLIEVGLTAVALVFVFEIISTLLRTNFQKKQKQKDCNHAISVLRKSGFNVGFVYENKQFEQNENLNTALRAYGCLRMNGIPFLLLDAKDNPIGTMKACDENSLLKPECKITTQEKI